jgi:hypothetical protein
VFGHITESYSDCITNSAHPTKTESAQTSRSKHFSLSQSANSGDTSTEVDKPLHVMTN